MEELSVIPNNTEIKLFEIRNSELEKPEIFKKLPQWSGVVEKLVVAQLIKNSSALMKPFQLSD
jgi:hypothetical protein